MTRIIATIGPACSDIASIHDLIRAGMDIARLNLSHGTHEDHREIFLRVRLASREIGKQTGIMIDIPGPKLRIKSLAGETQSFMAGENVTLSASPKPGEIGIGHAPYIPPVQAGDTILLADGAVTLAVTRTGPSIQAEVRSGGTVRNGAGVVIPGRRPEIAYAHDRFIHNLTFAAELDPDFLALSFVSSAQDLNDARTILTGLGKQIPIIAKIETRFAVDRFSDILKAADGVMVARGDLGVELPLACVPHVQKEIIRQCTIAGVPVITATEMLESMVTQGRPTRAEVTDVANAIADGTDATMLSAETSIGQNPALAVRTMAEIACETEKHLPYRKILDERRGWHETSAEGIIAYSACYLANELSSRAIVAFTRSGITAERVSRCRPKTPVLAITPDEEVARRLLIWWGIIPCIHEPIHTADDLFAISVSLATETGLAGKGEKMVIIAGNFAGVSGTTNMIKVQQIS